MSDTHPAPCHYDGDDFVPCMTLVYAYTCDLCDTSTDPVENPLEMLLGFTLRKLKKAGWVLTDETICPVCNPKATAKQRQAFRDACREDLRKALGGQA